jgi:hypothetical protein
VQIGTQFIVEIHESFPFGAESIDFSNRVLKTILEDRSEERGGEGIGVRYCNELIDPSPQVLVHD